MQVDLNIDMPYKCSAFARPNWLTHSARSGRRLYAAMGRRWKLPACMRLSLRIRLQAHLAAPNRLFSQQEDLVWFTEGWRLYTNSPIDANLGRSYMKGIHPEQMAYGSASPVDRLLGQHSGSQHWEPRIPRPGNNALGSAQPSSAMALRLASRSSVWNSSDSGRASSLTLISTQAERQLGQFPASKVTPMRLRRSTFEGSETSVLSAPLRDRHPAGKRNLRMEGPDRLTSLVARADANRTPPTTDATDTDGVIRGNWESSLRPDSNALRVQATASRMKLEDETRTPGYFPVATTRQRRHVPRTDRSTNLVDELFDRGHEQQTLNGLSVNLLPREKHVQASGPSSGPLTTSSTKQVPPTQTNFSPPGLSRTEVTKIADQVAKLLADRRRLERERQGRH